MRNSTIGQKGPAAPKISDSLESVTFNTVLNWDSASYDMICGLNRNGRWSK